jgi:hypothetical protein
MGLLYNRTFFYSTSRVKYKISDAVKSPNRFEFALFIFLGKLFNLYII